MLEPVKKSSIIFDCEKKNFKEKTEGRKIPPPLGWD
jgi:hypothetical protein